MTKGIVQRGMSLQQGCLSHVLLPAWLCPPARLCRMTRLTFRDKVNGRGKGHLHLRRVTIAKILCQWMTSKVPCRWGRAMLSLAGMTHASPKTETRPQSYAQGTPRSFTHGATLVVSAPQFVCGHCHPWRMRWR